MGDLNGPVFASVYGWSQPAPSEPQVQRPSWQTTECTDKVSVIINITWLTSRQRLRARTCARTSYIRPAPPRWRLGVGRPVIFVGPRIAPVVCQGEAHAALLLDGQGGQQALAINRKGGHWICLTLRRDRAGVPLSCLRAGLLLTAEGAAGSPQVAAYELEGNAPTENSVTQYSMVPT
jgi:hypothetical protein